MVVAVASPTPGTLRLCSADGQAFRDLLDRVFMHGGNVRSDGRKRSTIGSKRLLQLRALRLGLLQDVDVEIGVVENLLKVARTQ